MLFALSKDMVDWAHVIGAGVGLIALIVAGVSTYQAAAASRQADAAAKDGKRLADAAEQQLNVVRAEAAAAAEWRARAPVLQIRLEATIDVVLEGVRSNELVDAALVSRERDLALPPLIVVWAVRLWNFGDLTADDTQLEVLVDDPGVQVFSCKDAEGTDAEPIGVDRTLDTAPVGSTSRDYWARWRETVSVPRRGDTVRYYLAVMARGEHDAAARTMNGADPGFIRFVRHSFEIEPSPIPRQPRLAMSDVSERGADVGPQPA